MSTFGFEPGDIVTSVMSFGSSTPIAVRIVGTDLKMVRQHAEKIAAEMKHIPYLRDVQFEQTLDYPTVEVDIDREKAGLSGATVEDVAKAMVMATASTRFTNLNYWVDVKTGFDYLVQIQVPPAADGEAGRRRDLADRVGQPAGQPDGPRRGDGPQGRAARRDRPRHVAALPDPDGQRRGRGHGPGLRPGRPGDRGRRGAAPRRAGGDRWASSRRWSRCSSRWGSGWRSPCS